MKTHRRSALLISKFTL